MLCYGITHLPNAKSMNFNTEACKNVQQIEIYLIGNIYTEANEKGKKKRRDLRRIRSSGVLISGIDGQRISAEDRLNGAQVAGPGREVKLVALTPILRFPHFHTLRLLTQRQLVQERQRVPMYKGGLFALKMFSLGFVFSFFV